MTDIYQAECRVSQGKCWCGITDDILFTSSFIIKEANTSTSAFYLAAKMAFGRLLHVAVVIKRIGSFSVFCVNRNMRVSDQFETRRADNSSCHHYAVSTCSNSQVECSYCFRNSCKLLRHFSTANTTTDNFLSDRLARKKSWVIQIALWCWES